MGRAYSRPSVGFERGTTLSGLHFVERTANPDDEFAERQVLSEDLREWLPLAFSGPSGTIRSDAFRVSSFSLASLIRDAWVSGMEWGVENAYVSSPM